MRRPLTSPLPEVARQERGCGHNTHAQQGLHPSTALLRWWRWACNAQACWVSIGLKVYCPAAGQLVLGKGFEGRLRFDRLSANLLLLC